MVFKLPIQFGTKSKIRTKNSNCDNNRFFILISLTIILCTTILSKHSQSQPKPPGKSNLVKIGNCTYSIIGNISAFNDAVKDQKVGNYQDALQKYLRSLNNVYKCNYKSYKAISWFKHLYHWFKHLHTFPSILNSFIKNIYKLSSDSGELYYLSLSNDLISDTNLLSFTYDGKCSGFSFFTLSKLHPE